MSFVAGAFWLLESRGNASVHRKTWRIARKQADALEEEVYCSLKKKIHFIDVKITIQKNLDDIYSLHSHFLTEIL